MQPNTDQLNEQSQEERYPWLEKSRTMDAKGLMLHGFAKRCFGCRRPTSNRHLNKDIRCPDCRE